MAGIPLRLIVTRLRGGVNLSYPCKTRVGNRRSQALHIRAQLQEPVVEHAINSRKTSTYSHINKIFGKEHFHVVQTNRSGGVVAISVVHRWVVATTTALLCHGSKA